MTWFVPIEIGLIMGLIFALTVLSLALSFRLLHFPDLTTEGSFPLGAAMFGTVLKLDYPIAMALVLSIAAGAVAGATTGFVHSHFRLNKFLAGIIVVSMAYSICLRLMGASNVGLLNETSLFDFVKPLDRWGSGRLHLGTIAVLLAIVAGTGILVSVFVRSRTGLRLRVAGTNPELAESLGINPKIALVVGLALTNSLAAASGALVASFQGFADVGMGQGILILALAAMTIGERLVPSAKISFHLFVISAAVIGSIAYQTIVAFAVRFGLAPTDLKLLTSILVLAIVAFRFSKGTDLLMETQN